MSDDALFTVLPLDRYNARAGRLEPDELTEDAYAHRRELTGGPCVLRGIPFCGSPTDDQFIYLDRGALSLDLRGVRARYLVFWHACNMPRPEPGPDGMIRAFQGYPPLGVTACVYRVRYRDGTSAEVPIRSRMEINDLERPWGQGGFLCVPHIGGDAMYTATDDIRAGRKPQDAWGETQPRVTSPGDGGKLGQWLFAWDNPKPDTAIDGIDIEHRAGRLLLFGVTAAHVEAHPLRHSRRQKVALTLDGDARDPMALIDIDLGRVISVIPRPQYDNGAWETGYNNQQPAAAAGEYIVEFAAHPDATFFVGERRAPLPVKEAVSNPNVRIAAAEQPVTLKVLGPDGRPVPVKAHAHGEAGEYLPPRHRHRIPNPYWFEDYSADYVNGPHYCCYIDGTAEYLLPQGEVFFEVSKGFEITPRRVRFNITPETDEIIIKLERALDWRSKGWVTADTHVHFLSPHTALLESEAEGVNVVNLLASQWGELFTNMGDFTGRDLVSPDKEYVVRTGTENRQSVLGHISLIGYGAPMILPLTTGGPNEAALGDPVDITLSDWARRSREQGGLAIMPHFPRPVGEGAAAMISNLIDGVEACSGSYNGIGPAFLSHWYRFLNCGYHIPVVGGTDKMGASTAIGTARTYAKIDGVFSYETWKDAVRAGHTFVSYGALCDIEVEGAGPGGKLVVKAGSAAGSSVTVNWRVASATVPVTSVELVVNGETADGLSYDGVLGTYEGSFRVPVAKSGWIALRVRGHMKDKPEIIIAHTSAVMLIVDGQPVFNTPDAVHILEQIEGVTAYIKNIGTKAQEADYKRALLSLSNAYNLLHNKLHIENRMHLHSAPDNHEGH